ncbi:MAG: glycosyltransferase family 4 protein [Mariniphaga sp.]|nr:glycosyltransferase family 4 protein [Mariniphaga sp.]
MKILALTRYSELGASSRLRSYQYFPFLESCGINICVTSFFDDDYLVSKYAGTVSLARIFTLYVKRLHLILQAKHFDLVWVEKEMIPWVPSLIELGLFHKRVPLVVDYDDAIFHRYDQSRFSAVRFLLGKKIDAVMRRADLVIVGNDYISERAKQAGAKFIKLIPTVVDISRYTVPITDPERPFTIGWIGSPITAPYLYPLTTLLSDLAHSKNIRILAIGANPEQVSSLPIETRPWSLKKEVEEIQHFDIGIMPLPDEPFERGKCGYKLIQYMACGKPVIASPVGINTKIVQEGVNGFLAETHEQWSSAFEQLYFDSSRRIQMGMEGRKLVETQYSMQINAPKIEKLLRRIAMKKGA